MTAIVTDVESLLDQLAAERDHSKAAVQAFRLAELVPGLVHYTQSLEQALKKSTRKLDFQCTWCGDSFQVYISEIQGKRKSGKYCSVSCSTEHHAALREAGTKVKRQLEQPDAEQES